MSSHMIRGRQLSRDTEHRGALRRNMAQSLFEHGKIRTTLPKAKAVVPYTEKLITKAKKGDLHNRRQVISSLQQVSTAHKLVDEIAPKLGGRNSGYFRITRTTHRRGDNAEMARVSFVDDLKEAPVAKSAAAEKPKAPPKKTAAKAEKPEVAAEETK